MEESTLATSVSARNDLASVRSTLHDTLRQLPSLGMDPEAQGPTEEHLSAAVTAVYRAGASESASEHARNVREAMEATRRALQLLQDSLSDVDDATKCIRRTARALATLVHSAVSFDEATLRHAGRLVAPQDLTASAGMPRILALHRDVFAAGRPNEPANTSSEWPLPVRLPIPQGIPLRDPDAMAKMVAQIRERIAKSSDELVTTKQNSASELASEVSTDADFESALLGEAVSRDEAERERAEESFISVGTLGVMRWRLANEPWWSVGTTEERLFKHFDVLMALGPKHFPHLARFAVSRPVPDFELHWAGIFLFGSLVGPDAADQVISFIHSSGVLEEPAEPEDPDELSMFDVIASALTVIPSGTFEEQLKPWLEHSDLRRRRLAVHVLGKRRAAPIERVLSSLAHSNPDVAIAALTAVEASFDAVDAAMLSRSLRHSDLRVVATAIETAIARDFWAAPVRCEEVFRDALLDGSESGRSRWIGRIAQLYALCASAGSERMLIDVALHNRSADAIAALGWFGGTACADALLGLLDDPELAEVAGSAFLRIAGTSPLDESGQPMTRAEDAVLDPPVPLDPGEWRAWWEHTIKSVPRNRRLRWGRPWSPIHNVWEMEGRPSSVRERRYAFLELVARTQSNAPFDPLDFVVRQRLQLEEWRRQIEYTSRSSQSGQFTVQMEN